MRACPRVREELHWPDGMNSDHGQISCVPSGSVHDPLALTQQKVTHKNLDVHTPADPPQRESPRVNDVPADPPQREPPKVTGSESAPVHGPVADWAAVHVDWMGW